MGFKGKTVVVTGGVYGIGNVIVESFVKAGADVIFGDVVLKEGRIYAKKLREELGPATFFPLDVSKEKSVKSFILSVKKASGKIDVLINNAGIGGWKDIRKRPLSEWHKIINTNLTGPFQLSKYALPLMPAGSSIVNISSTRALMSEENTEPYSASKGGLVALTHSLAVSLAKDKIRVNAISPGWINTGHYKITKKDNEQHPAGRVGKPEDIAEACLFLADSEKAGFITGQNLVVDGGITIKMHYD